MFDTKLNCLTESGHFQTSHSTVFLFQLSEWRIRLAVSGDGDATQELGLDIKIVSTKSDCFPGSP